MMNIVKYHVKPKAIAQSTATNSHRILSEDSSLDERSNSATPKAEQTAPTIGTMVIGRFVYVANGQFEAHDDEGRRRPNTTLTGARLVAVRVDDETR